MYGFKKQLKIGCFLLLVSLGCSTKNDPAMNARLLCVDCSNDKTSIQSAEYLYHELEKRADEKNIISFRKEKKECFTVYIMIDPEMVYDYDIEPLNRKVILKAKNVKVMKWLSFQFLSILTQKDSRFYGNDLPPAVITYGKQQGNFDFIYREPHFQTNLLDNNYTEMLCTHSVDRDWGLWGHNLNEALEDNEDDSIYAWVDGHRIEEQYCFSNNSIFTQLSDFIINNFGESEEYTQRFMIMPEDNPRVCMCSQCRSMGNTKESATPALSHLITRLALRFPNHQFFTSAYLTGTIPPHTRWPDNTGVMISTMGLPRGVALVGQKEADQFLQILHKWKECTPNIYIWDYAANFDDYLTPLPVLYGLKKQLGYFKSQGVKGVFLNANGYDYTPVDDMKTYVAANLMMNTNLSVDSLCHIYLKKFYPVSAKILGDYYLSLEKKADRQNQSYNMYGGFHEAVDNYLDPNEFVSFYKDLENIIPETTSGELEKLEKLFIALTFTRLQIAYYQKEKSHGFIFTSKNEPDPLIYKLLDRLDRHKVYKDMSSYKEYGGSLDLYKTNWIKLLANTPLNNKLVGEPIQVHSRLDSDYDRIEILNDGVTGFESEYHQGWLLCSNNQLSISFGTGKLKDARHISMRFMVDKKHNIYPPEKVTVYVDHTLYDEIILANDPERSKKLVEEIVVPVNLSEVDSLSIVIHKRKYPECTMACDEIVIN